MCEASWCKALLLDDPSEYKYRSLPFKRPISHDGITRELGLVFKKYAHKADQLCNLGSSQANESLNNAIARKAPKFQHYSSSESLLYRISATVAEKKGSSYTVEI